MNMHKDDQTEAFIRLLAEHERRLAVYVTSLVGRPQDAQDILQEGKLVMWRHFERFEQGTNFGAWARKIRGPDSGEQKSLGKPAIRLGFGEIEERRCPLDH